MTGRGRLVLRATTGRYLLAGLTLATAALFLWKGVLLQRLPSLGDIGPAAFPLLVAGLLAVAGVALAFGIGDGKPADVAIEHPWAILGVLAIVAGFALSLNRVPVLVAVAGATALIQWLLGERRLSLILGGSAALAGTIWLLFGVLLNVPLL